MTRVVLWSSSAGDIPANLAFTNNFTATADPAVTDDITDGYSPGSIWINATTDQAFVCTDNTDGAAVWSSTTDGGAQGQVIAPAASTPTGAGGAALLRGGTGGATSGSGGAAQVTGGAATGTNSAGGSVVLTPGAKTGTGIAGGIRNEGLIIRAQGAPAAKTVSATLTAAELTSGIITVNQGAAGASALQVPTGTAIQAGLPADFATGDSFDVSVINISTVDAEDASVTVNTDVTLVGSMDFLAYSAAGLRSSGIIRFRKTADHVFVGYRIA